MIDSGIITDVIKKSAGWYSYVDNTDPKKPIEIKAHGEDELVSKLMPIMPKVYERIHGAMESIKTVTRDAADTIVPAEASEE